MNVLIIGKDSYIGNHIDEWLTKAGHKVTQLDVLNEDWKVYDYSPYDAIVHVAGIVHRPDCKDWNLYKSVNTDMPIGIAKKFRTESRELKDKENALSSKQNSSKLFIYFSTMGVYDSGKKLGPSVVDENTPLLIDGNSMYGKSKAMAEEGLLKLREDSLEAGENFNVAIVRPPSVYGKGCKGGYISGFTMIVKTLPVIPRAYLDARQSFIYIDNLCECVRQVVEQHRSGIFCPQDDETPNANELFGAIANGLGRKYRDSRLLGILMQMVSFIPLVKKAFGGIEYARSLSDIKDMNYVVVPFKEGMKRTVGE